MTTLILILLLLSAVCFVAAAVNVASPRVNLVALGLAFWVIAILAPVVEAL